MVRAAERTQTAKPALVLVSGITPSACTKAIGTLEEAIVNATMATMISHTQAKDLRVLAAKPLMIASIRALNTSVEAIDIAIPVESG
jgi:hypothetical protein